MTEPHIAAKEPVDIELEPGTHKWCQCGLSKTQPFCDDSHRGQSELKSLRFEITEKKTVSLCQCKHTKTPPYCDDTHKSL